MPPPVDDAAPLRSALLCAACALGGLVIALAGVYAGTGWLDGFTDWDVQRLGRRFLRALPWAAPLAAVAGVLLHAYYRLLLARRYPTWLALLGAARAFALFPLIGLALLFAFLLALALGIASLIGNKLLGLPTVPDNLLERLIGPPLWYLTLPFTLLGLENQGSMRIPQRVGRARLLRWLPFLIGLLLLWCGAESKHGHQRVDPHWLAVAAAGWFIDYLIVLAYVVPRWRRNTTSS